MDPYARILLQIEALGYAASVHRMGAYVELHAVPLAGDEVKIVRVEGDSDDAVYRGACELAAMCGID